MNKMAVIGDSETVLPYKAFGFMTFSTTSAECDGIIRKLMSDEEYRIIFIMEEYAEALRDVLKELRASERTFPIVIEVPGIRGSKGNGQEKIKKIVERAVGMDIFSKED
ncbi:MAG: V-type ATP synthase subunit F [Euryarchaeota archaeon]|nr:V-type ATP synthase subunit F [Euryarchaeota archaeon]MBU4033144.1 V-type ATP synthase subunit F [Candidatus Thermoplasmatota archaeon]MBU4072075.1 V-type ATP synthase subunit F [Candidatus Thermoplasmatota archaeon]MBU4143385.1 V-type ATP synthase subunit F [Candidatus Thermoplasmatota archaeon]